MVNPFAQQAIERNDQKGTGKTLFNRYNQTNVNFPPNLGQPWS